MSKFIKKESKSPTFNSTPRSSVWKTLWISSLWLSWTLIALLKSHLLKIFLAFFNFWHLKNKPLLQNFISFDSLDFFFLIFLLLIFCFWIWWWHFLFSWDGDMLQDYRDILHFLSRTALCKPVVLTHCLIPLEKLGRSQSFLFLNIEHCPGMIAPNQ